ncbi:lysophospholipase-like protein 1 [Ostrea edulis]|uniref:lysophospholipase-like protein 1 n=1 Tax=Ostrea edulis TaxID=37623 RepID=UPI002094344D|nr:lysophospholipase-like protein 1 [Ostrea edulis]
MMASKWKVLPRIVSPSGPKNSASVIWLHGSGDTGPGLLEWIKMVWKEDFNFSHIKVIFPSADPMPYTLNGGNLSTVWYDRLQLSPKIPENLPSIDVMATKLNELVQTEVNSGIPLSRIVIGGFSMGGGMALHLVYRYQRQVAGCFALSSFLNNDSKVYKELKNIQGQPSPPLFQCHGTRDELVLFDWGRETYKTLEGLGVKVDFHDFDLDHEFNKEELSILREWILDRLPPV